MNIIVGGRRIMFLDVIVRHLVNVFMIVPIDLLNVDGI